MKNEHCIVPTYAYGNKRQTVFELFIRDVAEKSRSSYFTNTAEADTETCISFPRKAKRFLILYSPGFSKEHSSSIDLLAEAHLDRQPTINRN